MVVRWRRGEPAPRVAFRQVGRHIRHGVHPVASVADNSLPRSDSTESLKTQQRQDSSEEEEDPCRR